MYGLHRRLGAAVVRGCQRSYGLNNGYNPRREDGLQQVLGINWCLGIIISDLGYQENHGLVGTLIGAGDHMT